MKGEERNDTRVTPTPAISKCADFTILYGMLVVVAFSTIFSSSNDFLSIPIWSHPALVVEWGAAAVERRREGGCDQEGGDNWGNGANRGGGRGCGDGGGIMQEGHAHVLVAYRRRLAPFFASLRCSYPMLLWMECRWDAGRGGRDH